MWLFCVVELVFQGLYSLEMGGVEPLIVFISEVLFWRCKLLKSRQYCCHGTVIKSVTFDFQVYHVPIKDRQLENGTVRYYLIDQVKRERFMQFDPKVTSKLLLGQRVYFHIAAVFFYKFVNVNFGSFFKIVI